MLEYMHVKNLALINECELSFGEGLNILTGETGAGKSVLLGSINLALGAKADKDIIRAGESEAFVELMFSVSDSVKKILEALELSDTEESVCISRKITPTKNVYKINGEIVTARQVKELAGGLLDIHGQHEHQSLLSNSKQRDMLDAFGTDAIKAALLKVKEAYTQYIEIKNELNEAMERSEGRDREISLLEYECTEIEEAHLVPGEDEALEENYKRMQASEKLISLMNEATALISSDSLQDAGSLVSKAISCMRKVSAMDESAENMEKLLTEAESILGDFSMEASRYMESLEFSPEDFNETEERLNVINSLKMKFGSSIEKILEYYEDKSKELEKLKHLDEVMEALKEKAEKLLNAYKKAANELSLLRKKASKDFASLLMQELMNLNFYDASFEVMFNTDESLISESGFDKIEFMISTNPGEQKRPMKNVASGGELSRIMLAVKTILAKKDEVDALIFDEIDTGISGKTAWEVSGRLSKLSKEHQVIAITHLPQIAAAADVHFEIEKTVDDGVTSTNIYRLDEEGEIKELSRMLGSGSFDEATMNNAKELKKKAKERE